MSTPTVRVELSVGVDYEAPYFRLNDPVRSELDAGLYPLYNGTAPDLTVDLTADAYAYSVSRGRPSEMDDVNTGTLAVDFRNYDALYLFGATPTDPASGFTNDDIIPGKRVRLYLDEVPVFDGFVDDWSTSFDVSGECSASLVAWDALGTIAQTALEEWTTTAQTADVRIEAVLDRTEVGFPGSTRDIGADGAGDIQDDTVDAGTNALTYIRKVVYSALGYVFASRVGLLTFRPRKAVVYTVSAAFSDDGVGIPFTNIQPASSRRFLYNRVSVTRLGGVEQVAEDATSQATYGVRTLTLTDMLMNTDTDALNLAGSLVARYASPTLRIQSMTVNLGSLTAAQRATVLGLELGDSVTLQWTPPGSVALPVTGMRVEGIAIDGTYSSLGMVTLQLSPADYIPFPFKLNDPVYSQLDAGNRVYY